MDQEAQGRFVVRVKALEAFGHRGSATENEARAAEYLCGELRAMGLDPVLEPFAGLSSGGAVVLLHVALSLAAASLVWTWPIVSLVAGLVALGSMLLENAWRVRALSHLLPTRPSRNVVARVAAVGAPVKRIVVLGHYDTQRTGLIWNEGILSRIAPLLARSPGPSKSPLFLPMVAMFAVPIAATFALFAPGSGVAAPVAWAAIVVLSIATILLADWAAGPFVPGASDNATGSAAVLSVVESWKAEPVADVELVALLTGCEESGLYGSAAFVRAHAQAARELPTLFANLDGFGYGRPRYLGREHSLAGVPATYPADMIAACAATAQELQLIDAGPRSLPVQSDAYPLLRGGIPGVSILSFEDNGHLPNYHQLTDTSDRLDFDVAWSGVRFAEAIVRRLAADVRGPQ